jgi:hypothetical protein
MIGARVVIDRIALIESHRFVDLAVHDERALDSMTKSSASDFAQPEKDIEWDMLGRLSEVLRVPEDYRI